MSRSSSAVVILASPNTLDHSLKSKLVVIITLVCSYTYVLIAIVKKELHLDASLYTCLQILSVSVFEKTEISCALQLDRYTTASEDASNQLNLFDF